MKLKLVSVILILVGISWWLLMLVFGAFTGKIFEYIAVALLAVLFAAVIYHIEQDSPDSGDPYHLAFVYLGVASIGLGLLFNTVFMVMDKVIGRRWTIGVNILIIGLYVIASLILKNHLIHHDARRMDAGNRKDAFLELTESMTRILGAIRDPELRREFLRVKEAVDYGSKANLSEGRINEMKVALESVREAIASEDNKEHILERMKEAETLWKSGIARG